MKNLTYILTVLVIFSLVVGCRGSSATATPPPTSTPQPTDTPAPTPKPTDTPVPPTETPTPTATLMPTDTPTPTQTATPTETPEPTDTPTATPTETPTSTPTPEPTATAVPPTATATPSPTPYPQADFIHPVDLSLSPQYQAYDLQPGPGIVSNAGPEYSQPLGDCIDGWMTPGTNPDHFSYSWGAGGCGQDISEVEVNGMSVGFTGTVVRVPEYGVWINYGPLQLPNGQIKGVIFHYAHNVTTVSVGDKVDSNTVIGTLGDHAQEVDVQVFLFDPSETVGKSPGELFGYIVNQVDNLGVRPVDPRLIGLEPNLSYGPGE